MVECIDVIRAGSKEERYAQLFPQVSGLLAGETNRCANMANLSAALHEAFGFFWVGFYVVEGDELVLGPFQGPVACTRIARGRGVCGKAWAEARPLVVPDVRRFPGHIACNAAARSEVVVPLFANGKVVAVLDVDSDQPEAFDGIDVRELALICTLLLE